jgi:hypothetical protein
MSCRSPMLRARRSILVTMSTSPGCRNSRTVRSASRPSVVVPLRFSARMTSHPAARSAASWIVRPLVRGVAVMLSHEKLLSEAPRMERRTKRVSLRRSLRAGMRPLDAEHEQSVSSRSLRSTLRADQPRPLDVYEVRAGRGGFGAHFLVSALGSLFGTMSPPPDFEAVPRPYLKG